jgi:uncharacterized protein (DUF1800 family)
MRGRTFVAVLLCASVAATVARLGGAPAIAAAAIPAAIPDDRDAVVHALNRLTFGPRPGEVARVRSIGLGRWIEQQLAPSDIDDAALGDRLPAQPERPAALRDQKAARQYGRELVQQMAAAKVVRAVYSERQLEEILTDFWFNHFNVFAGKGRTALYLADYERAAIRPHVLGRFRDLLGATAKSPAMLFYLDNWLSADPAAAQKLAARRRAFQPGTAAAAAVQRRRGLNENYGRELLELHTLGVDGGYTQQDIIEVARAFTGWTVTQMADRPADGRFRFAAALHDTGEKVVLGHRIEAGGGIGDGEQVLDIVAAHPATARHVARRLAERFVSDTPPEALVARVARRFEETHGDLREVVRAVITSPEFFAAEARNGKVKTPLEFVASALRATGSDLQPRRAVQALQQLGMPPYMCQPPTGYDDDAETWISAGALVTRANIAQQLAGPEAAATIASPEFQRQ